MTTITLTEFEALLEEAADHTEREVSINSPLFVTQGLAYLEQLMIERNITKVVNDEEDHHQGV